MEQKVKMNDPRKTDFMYEEAIKTLRTNIQFAGRNVKCILLTSCFPNEGKSDIAFQLAKEIGNIGKRVILVDADIRKSTFASRYRIGRPVKEIPRDAMKKGDLLYFAGHIALYLGNDQYIHSTARTGSNGMDINSFNPEDTNYRKDLDEGLLKVGTIFW